MSKSGKTG